MTSLYCAGLYGPRSKSATFQMKLTFSPKLFTLVRSRLIRDAVMDHHLSAGSSRLLGWSRPVSHNAWTYRESTRRVGEAEKLPTLIGRSAIDSRCSISSDFR